MNNSHKRSLIIYVSEDEYKLFMEDISDRMIEKFLEVRENVPIDEFIDLYKETIGENVFSFLLGF